MNSSDIIQDAIHQVSVYKHPRIDEFRLMVGQVGKIPHAMEYDNITDIYEEDENLIVTTEYSLRCCSMQDRHMIPLNLFPEVWETQEEKWDR